MESGGRKVNEEIDRFGIRTALAQDQAGFDDVIDVADVGYVRAGKVNEVARYDIRGIVPVDGVQKRNALHVQRLRGTSCGSRFRCGPNSRSGHEREDE